MQRVTPAESTCEICGGGQAEMTTLVEGRKFVKREGGVGITGRITAMLCPTHRAEADRGPRPVGAPNRSGPAKPGADQVTIFDVLGGAA